MLDARSFDWDGAYNRVRRADDRASGIQRTHDYAYDAVNRLAESTRTPEGGSPSVVDYALDAAGNRTLTGYALEDTDALLNQYTRTPFQARGYDGQGNWTVLGAKAAWHRYDAENRLIAHAEAGTRTLDDFGSGLPVAYTVLSGTWQAADGVLEETSSASGRILRSIPADADEFAFSYRTPHDPADPDGDPQTQDYLPEYYALAVLRRDDSTAPQPSFALLVIEPNALYVREWDADGAVVEHAAAAAESEADTWYDVEVEYGGDGGGEVTVRWGKHGAGLVEVFGGPVTLDLEADAGQEIGFGTGAAGDYAFRDVYYRTDTDTEETVVVTYAYDALGRRVARTIDPDGTPETTYFYYDGPRVVEERDGTGALEASYVYGLYVDEVLQMRRGTDDYYFHADDHYNVFALTDDAGAVVERYDYGDFGLPEFYAPDGTPRTESAFQNPYLFTGRRWDSETGLYYYRARHMDPAAGRFLSRDPLGLWGDPMNLGVGSAYAGGNPWTYGDPYGNFTLGEWGEIIGAFFRGGTEPIIDYGNAVAGATAQDYNVFKYVTAISAPGKDRFADPDYIAIHGTQWSPNWLDTIHSGQKLKAEVQAGVLDVTVQAGQDVVVGKGAAVVAGGAAAAAGSLRKVDDAADAAEAQAPGALRRLWNWLSGKPAVPAATFGKATSFDYRATFFTRYPELKGRVVVHHAVPQRALKLYPEEVTELEIHSLENLRGIPLTDNAELHLSQIAKEWNTFYKLYPSATKEQLLQKAFDIDKRFGLNFEPPIGGAR